MAQIPPVKTLRVEEFPDEQKAWIGKLITPLNLFMTITANSLSSALTFGSNIQGQEYLLDFTYNVPSDLPKSFRNDLPVRPRALTLVSATENGLPVILAHSWQLTSDQQVQISDLVKLTSSGVSALVAGARYQARFRSMP